MSSKTQYNTEMPTEETVELQLGDIIQIMNPTNDRLNGQTFIIDYLDKSKLLLINTDTLDTLKLTIGQTGIIGDGSITKLAILSRSDEKGYARQNSLLPNTWIDIHFNGDFPAILTGEITNLENDMIEIRTIDNDTLYLNFEYKGIHEDLPISMIEIRDKPKLASDVLDQGIKQGIEQQGIEERELEEGEIEDTIKGSDINVPIKNIKNQLREFVLKADQIRFG